MFDLICRLMTEDICTYNTRVMTNLLMNNKQKGLFIKVFICDLFVSRDDSLMSQKTFTRTEHLYVLSHDTS